MIGKAMVFGAGYVLGAKAGHGRYRQIRTVTSFVARRLQQPPRPEGEPTVPITEEEQVVSTRRTVDPYDDIRLPPG